MTEDDLDVLNRFYRASLTRNGRNDRVRYLRTRKLSRPVQRGDAIDYSDFAYDRPDLLNRGLDIRSGH